MLESNLRWSVCSRYDLIRWRKLLLFLVVFAVQTAGESMMRAPSNIQSVFILYETNNQTANQTATNAPSQAYSATHGSMNMSTGGVVIAGAGFLLLVTIVLLFIVAKQPTTQNYSLLPKREADDGAHQL
jgi:hypothetical protein